MENKKIEKSTNSIALLQKNITDSVITRVTELEKEGLMLPKGYSVTNALKSAFFEISDEIWRECTQKSIANSLLDMVIQGLSPNKKQCHFIRYKEKCELVRSYFGTVTVAKRLENVIDVYANIIYKDDVFEYGNVGGINVLIKHIPNFENIDKGMIGAYAIIERKDGKNILTPMTKKEIETSWSQSKTQLAVHKKFPTEMAKRTVLNRACKFEINTSNDDDLLVGAINRTMKNEYEEISPFMEEVEIVKDEIKENANMVVVDLDKEDDTEFEISNHNEPKKDPF